MEFVLHNIRTFSLFRDGSSMKSVRLFTGFYLFIIDTRSRKVGLS